MHEHRVLIEDGTYEVARVGIFYTFYTKKQ